MTTWKCGHVQQAVPRGKVKQLHCERKVCQHLCSTQLGCENQHKTIIQLTTIRNTQSQGEQKRTHKSHTHKGTSCTRNTNVNRSEKNTRGSMMAHVTEMGGGEKWPKSVRGGKKKSKKNGKNGENHGYIGMIQESERCKQ